MIENDKIKISPTKSENLLKIIEIEKNNSEFIGQYSLMRHKEVLTNENEKHLSVFDKSDNSLVGYIILAGFSEKNNSIEFRRIAISKKGVGFGKSALNLIKKMSFEIYKTHRLWLDVFKDNQRAVSLYENEKFQKEGELRDCIKENEIYRSILIMSILENEYEKSE